MKREPMYVLKAAEHAGVVCAAVRGDVSQKHLAPGDDPLSQGLGNACYTSHVLLDLSRIAWIDSSGVGWLIACQKRFRAAGGALVVHSPPQFAREMFGTLRLHLVLTLAADEAEARRLVAG